MSKVLEKNKKLLGDAVLNLLDIVDKGKIINRIGEEKIIEIIGKEKLLKILKGKDQKR